MDRQIFSSCFISTSPCHLFFPWVPPITDEVQGVNSFLASRQREAARVFSHDLFRWPKYANPARLIGSPRFTNLSRRLSMKLCKLDDATRDSSQRSRLACCRSVAVRTRDTHQCAHDTAAPGYNARLSRCPGGNMGVQECGYCFTLLYPRGVCLADLWPRRQAACPWFPQVVSRQRLLPAS